MRGRGKKINDHLCLSVHRAEEHNDRNESEFANHDDNFPIIILRLQSGDEKTHLSRGKGA
jgi:hypothetical protein